MSEPTPPPPLPSPSATRPAPRSPGLILAAVAAVALFVVALAFVVGPTVQKVRDKVRASSDGIDLANDNSVAELQQRFDASKERLKQNIDEIQSDAGKAVEARDRFFSEMQATVGSLAETTNDDQKRFAEVMQGYLAEVEVRAREFGETFLAVNNPGTLDYTALRSPGAFDERRERIDAYARVTEEYARFFAGTIATMSQRLSVLGPDNEYAKGAIEGARKQIARQKPAVEALMQLHAEYAPQLQATLDFLEQSLDAWETQDGKIIFQQEEDLNTFNELLQKLVDTETRLNAASRKVIESVWQERCRRGSNLEGQRHIASPTLTRAVPLA